MTEEEIRAAAIAVAASLIASRGMNRTDRDPHELAKPVCSLADIFVPYIRDGKLADIDHESRKPRIRTVG